MPECRRTSTITSTEPARGGRDWRWQLRHAVRDPEELGALLGLGPGEVARVRAASGRGLPLLVPRPYLALARAGDPRCPIRLQCVPGPEEGTTCAGDREDPLGERRHEVAPHLIRRYPDRALLIATLQCAVHCRFCTRSRLVRTGRGASSMRELGPALRWLRAHPEVRELIVSGGDPLTLSTRRLVRLITKVREVPSVRLIRIGTRMPTVLPMRIDRELVDGLAGLQPVWFMLHFNHPRELTRQACEALAKLADGGYPMMNQTVLLRGVNDEAGVLANLFRGLIEQRVRPYYLLHADVMAGTGHLRTTVARSIALFSQLQGSLSGIALPKLVIDTPGGGGKVVVGPETVVKRGRGRTTVRTFRGELIDIVDPPVGQTR